MDKPRSELDEKISRLKKGDAWSRLSSLDQNLDSAVLSHRGSHSDSRVRQKLEKLLEFETRRSNDLLERLKGSEEKLLDLSGKFEKFRLATEEESNLFIEKYRELEEEKKTCEKKLYSLTEEFKNFEGDLDQSRSKQILKLSLQNGSLRQSETELKAQIAQLRDRLREREAVIKETVPVIAELKSLLDKTISEAKKTSFLDRSRKNC